MRKNIAIATVLLAPLFATATAITPADAAGSKCVDRKEFAQVKKGMKAKKVHQIFDTSGKVVIRDAAPDGTPLIGRTYKGCTQYGSVSVVFAGDVVLSKAAYWG